MGATPQRTGRLEPSKASMQRGGRILEKSRKAELQKLRSREQRDLLKLTHCQRQRQIRSKVGLFLEGRGRLRMERKRGI